MHPTGNIGERDTLIYPILEERDCPVASIVEDANSGRHLFALAPVAEDSARLKPVLINADKFERPHVPVDARR